MPKDRKARSETRSKGKPYVKSGSTNSDHDDNVPNQAVGEEEEPAICVVCDAVIQDPTEDDPSSGDQALFCEGKCEAWFHRKCAGLSKSAYSAASESEAPFYCLYCLQIVHAGEIAELKA